PRAGPRGFPPRHRRRRQPAAGHGRRLSAPVAVPARRPARRARGMAAARPTCRACLAPRLRVRRSSRGACLCGLRRRGGACEALRRPAGPRGEGAPDRGQRGAPPRAGNSRLCGRRLHGGLGPFRVRRSRGSPHRGQPRPVGDLRGDDGGVLFRAGALRRCAPPRAPAPGAPGLAARPALARSGERRAQREAGHDMTTITPKFTQMASGLRFPAGPVAMPDGSVSLVWIERRPRARVTGPNDLVFDGAGGFWFTDLGKTRERDADRGVVYYAKADGSQIREAIFPLERPNGIGLSPDERTLYVVETPTARCWSFKLSAPGQIES